MTDRAMQALYLQGLDPIAETKADGHSYGFRLERRCADAIEQCHNVLSNKHSACWILEGDIKACFDSIDHGWLMKNIPMDKVILSKWLKAGFLENEVWFATREGTPQGGIISPVLANWALDGLQPLLEERFRISSRRNPKVHLVRYADDFIITGLSRVLLEYEVKPLVEHFLKERGLELSHEKTRITHIDDGFDFLGQTVRCYPSDKVIIKPSRRSIKTFLDGIKETLDDSRSRTAGTVIQRLNQQIKGWTMYHRHVASKRIFTYVDYRIFRMVWRWCRRRHKKKTTEWIRKRYFPKVGSKDWVFTGTLRDSKGKGYPTTLMSAAQVKIIPHIKIRQEVNPYNPAWELYLEERLGWKIRQTQGKYSRVEELWKVQEGRCLRCGHSLRLKDDDWHIHHRVWRSHGGGDTIDNQELLHANCHRQLHIQEKETGEPTRVPRGTMVKA
jgi:RNA-directed DNA polymerase